MEELTQKEVNKLNSTRGIKALLSRPFNIERAIRYVDYERKLKKLQVELIRMQTWAINNNERIIILFEGRDVAGKGGTSWSRIEHHRNQHRQSEGSNPADQLGLSFQDWGIDTVSALKMLNGYTDRSTLISSGGLRNGIDMVKSVILGASICGMAAPFLKPAMESPEAVVEQIERVRKEFKTAMFLLGIKDVNSLINNDSLLLNERD